MRENKMKSCWIVGREGESVLEYREVPVPQPPPGTLLVLVQASALNRGELMIGSVMHAGPEKIGGTEVSGTVQAVGSGVTGFRMGDRVMGRMHGGWAEYAVMEAEQAMPVPDHLSWTQAAAFPVSMLVAYDALVTYGKLKAGESVLVLGATAGTGVACIQLAQLLGGRTIGTSGSQEKLERVREIGLDVALRTRAPDFSDKVLAATGGSGADVAVNLVGGSYLAETLKSLARRGRVAIVGYVDGMQRAEVDLATLHANRLEMFGLSNSRATREERAETVRSFSRDVLPIYRERKMRPVVDRVFGFHELAAAKAYMESNAMVGKVVVEIGRSNNPME